MEREPIPLDEFLVQASFLWDKQWMLLTPGSFAEGRFNTMPVGWGSLGTMWGTPFAQVVVRPSRYTYEFIEKYKTFTLSAFPEEWRHAVLLLGSKSGRSGDKISEAGLTPIASSRIPAPGFAEADLIIECRKIYWDDMEPARFLAPDIAMNYPDGDFHRIYFGEIVAVHGMQKYRVPRKE
jgi:flavin reductase (DIM6/NTAB) family NADH-FMN oxidoreductase RutF